MAEAVRLVVWDLDETFWKGTLTEGGIREYVQAHHDIVIALARRGIPSSICSKNDSAPILAILEEKGIRDYFIFPSICWEPKGMRLAQLVETVQLRAATVMFIDDNPNNRAEAEAMVPGLQIADETFIPQMLDDPRFAGKDDPDLTRLKQYKLLEARKRDEAQAVGGNEAFLRSCDIRVMIEYDVEAHIDRAIELINRTNQLNYTKKRLPEDPEAARKELRKLMSAFDRASGLVRVVDKYGDYGFVGFFMTGGMRQRLEAGAANRHLVHYCFSCRSLGMLIEDWVYNFLGRPELDTVGDVLTDLSIRRHVDWVRLGRNGDEQAVTHTHIAPRIVFYGGCEAQAIGVYLTPYTETIDVFGNYVAGGIFSILNYAAHMLDRCDRDPALIASELEIFGLPPHMETGDLFADSPQGTLFIVNFAMDAGGGDRLRHKIYDWTFLLSPNTLGWDTIYSTTDEELTALLANGEKIFTDEQLAQIMRSSQHLRANYERVSRFEDADRLEDMRNLIARIPAASKLIIITDHHERRDSSGTKSLRTSPAIVRYRELMQTLAGQFPYVGSISVSDCIENPAEIIDGNHYHRAVYFRLAEKIIAVEKQLAPRRDPAPSKRRIARMLAETRIAAPPDREAHELVHAVYKTLMRREPDPESYAYFVKALSDRRMSSADLVRAITATNEFNDKWVAAGGSRPAAPANTEDRAPMSTRIDHRTLRVPDELTITQSQPKRVLIVGSCLSEGWAHRMRGLPAPCDSDVYLLGRDLPEQPEHPVADYDFQIVQPALRFVLPDAAFARLDQADLAGHETLFAHAVNGMRRYLDGTMRWNREHGILTFVFAFIVPMQNAVGRLLPRYDLRNPVYFIEKLNEALAKEIEAYHNVYFFDLNEIHAFHGKRYLQEDAYSALNHGAYMSDFDFQHDQNRLEATLKASDLFEERVFDIFTAAWQELVSLYRTVRQADAVKLVVIDLDDTLWRGVIAELDADSMPTTEGWPKGFWEALLFLKRRGILLAIISKNEEARVVAAWDKLLARQLKLDDFAIRRINWRPKPENMAEILAHVNLLPGSVLYIDDNPAERAAMQAAFPDIRVLGGTPLAWRRILLWSSETQVPTITAESASRTDMVRAQVVREEQRARMSREEFLASLNVRMTLFAVPDADHPRFPRVLELINKTNQFNTTGKRWTREECIAAFAAGVAFHAFEVSDLYTDYGLVGVLIVDGHGIRQFVMSCRIMGLEAEVAAVAQIGNLLRAAGAVEMFAAMVETDRNQPCRNLYSRCGFTAAEGGWRRPLEPWFEVPAHITLTLDRPTPQQALAAE